MEGIIRNNFIELIKKMTSERENILKEYYDLLAMYEKDTEELLDENTKLREALKKFSEFDDKNCDSYAWIRRVATEALEVTE